MAKDEVVETKNGLDSATLFIGIKQLCDLSKSYQQFVERKVFRYSQTEAYQTFTIITPFFRFFTVKRNFFKVFKMFFSFFCLSDVEFHQVSF